MSRKTVDQASAQRHCSKPGRSVSNAIECQLRIVGTHGTVKWRGREFNEVTALEAAIECFWQRGYEATSVRDLANKMGLSAPSLYNTYGNKHALFVQALERYLHHSTRARIERLEKSLPPKQ